MQRILLFVIFVTGIAGWANSQRVSSGECPKVSVKPNLDVGKYVGLWYEIEKNPESFEAGLKCINAKYGNEGDYVSVLNSGVNISTGERTYIEGKATIPDKEVPAKLKVEFDNMPGAANYWILDTDYENYSVVYSCFSVMDIFKGEFLWILSRTPVLSDEMKEKAFKVIEDNGISREGLAVTLQDC